MGIKSVKPVGTNELHLEYEPISSSSEEARASVTLALLFDETTKRLEDAKVSAIEEIDVLKADMTFPVGRPFCKH